MSFRRFLLLFCAIAALGEIAGQNRAAAPRISQITPRAVRPGKQTLLTLEGSNLESASNLWTSFGGNAVRIVSTNKGQAIFSVECPADAGGIQALQLIGASGASDFDLIMVDPLDTGAGAENNHKPESAHPITIPAAVDGAARREESDFYRFRASAGQACSIEVIAHRIGSEMDPVCQVLDGDGREVAFCDDAPGVWRDARFHFKAPTEGEYTLVVHDAAYGGGNQFFYRLRVTNDPLIWFTFPLNDPAEETIAFEEIGVAGIRAPSRSPANPLPASHFGSLPQLVEREPNDSIEKAASAAVPMVVHGRIGNGRDVDFFRFSARKGQKLVFQSQTRSLGSPCDLVLTLKKSDGAVLAQSDLNAPGDAALTNKFSETAPVLLEVRELSGTAIPNAPYRIKVQKFVSGFSLTAENNIINLKPGDSAKLKITAVRHDFTGPIQLALEHPTDGIALEQSEIPEKKNEIELKVTAASSASPGAFHHLSLIGKNTDGFSTPVSTRPALRNQFPLMLNPPTPLENLFVIAIRD